MKEAQWLRLEEKTTGSNGAMATGQRIELGPSENEKIYRTLFDSIDEGFCIIEVLFDANDTPYDYRFLEVNPAFEQQTGLIGALGRTVREYAPDHEDFWYQRYAKVARTGEPIRFENNAAAIGRYFDVFAFRIGTPDQNRVAVLFRDISKRKQQESSRGLTAGVAEQLIGLGSIDETMQHIGETLGLHFDVKQCILAELSDDLETSHVRHGWNANGSPTHRGSYRIRDFLSDELFEANSNGNALVVNDTATDGRVSAESYGALGIRSFIIIPLSRDRVWRFMLSIIDDKPRHWREDEIDLLSDLAERIWARIERARAYDELNRRASADAFRVALNDVLRPLSDLKDIQGEASRLLGEHLKAQRVTYAQIEHDQIVVHRDYTQGVISMVGSYPREAFGKMISNAFDTSGTYVLVDAPGDPDLTPEEKAAYQTMQIGAFVAITLVKRGTPTAILAAHSSQPREWTSGEMALVEEVAERVWSALERARAEEALRASEERLTAVANVAPDLLWSSEVDGSTTWYNDRWMEYTGQTFEQALKWGWGEAIHPEDRALSVQRYHEAVQSRSSLELENRIRNAAGNYRWHLIRIEPLRDSEGHVLRMYGAATDIHDLREVVEKQRLNEVRIRAAKEEAEAANRAKDDFLAALSHELRNPLNPVLLSSSELSQDTTLSKEVREELGMIHRNIELEARLIDDLLDLTRIAQGKMRLQLEVCDVHTLLRHTEEILRADAATAGVALQFQLEADKHHALADAARLQQVFWNLIKNGIKFSGSQSSQAAGCVTVHTLNPTPDRLAVEIRDNGIGIRPDAMAKIFRPFEQGDQGGHRFGGLGLGLTIAKKVVDLHHGKLKATSPGAEQGSTFTIELTATPAPVPQAPHSQTAGPTVRPLRLLVVEDHAPTLAAVSRLLQRDGHHIHPAKTATEALLFSETQDCDLVISDIGLPDLTGVELMRELRARRGWPGIALSGYGMETDIQASLNAGFHTHLVKPLTAASLRRAIHDAITAQPTVS